MRFLGVDRLVCLWDHDNQQVEVLVKCRVLNRMASLGLPISERVLLY